jgi:hypothetical protein
MYLEYCFKFQSDIKKSVKTHFINLRAAAEPQGSFNGLSKVLPKRISSAECCCKNWPENGDELTVRIDSTKSTLNLNAPSYASLVVS